MARSRARKASWVRSLGYDALQNPSCRQAPFGLGRVDREGEQSWWAREEPAWEATKVRVTMTYHSQRPFSAVGSRSTKVHPTRAIETLTALAPHRAPPTKTREADHATRPLQLRLRPKTVPPRDIRAARFHPIQL